MDERFLGALIVAAALSGWSLWYAARALRGWRRYRSESLLTQTQAKPPATARIDAALTLGCGSSSAPKPRQSSSPRSEERAAYETILESAHMPEEPASAVVKEWARGRGCAMCRGAVTESWFAGHHIALLEPTGMTREWVDVGADRLALALATSLPLCWNCHVAATFRRTHPELVTDRDDSTVHVRQDQGIGN